MRALLIVGLAPGMTRRQPHRPAVHRRLCRRPALLDPAEVRLRPRHLRADPDDGLRLVDCRIANAVRCLPPENKPLPVEFTTCRPFLQAELAVMPELKVILALGKGAHDQVLRALTVRPAGAYPVHPRPAAHAADRACTLADSYHCSRYNTNTGRLTTEMFHDGVRGRAEHNCHPERSEGSHGGCKRR